MKRAWRCRPKFDLREQRALNKMPDMRLPVRQILILALLPALAACAAEGDLGRHDPSLVTTTYATVAGEVRERLHFIQDEELPLTAAEDALRDRAADLVAISRVGMPAERVRPRRGDGIARIEAFRDDIEVDTQRFRRFMRAADKVMQIDDARERRLRGLDALAATRQREAVKRRRWRNAELIRNGVRLMRERAEGIKYELKRLSVARPDVPLDEVEEAYEVFNEDVVRFHARIDQSDYLRLGEGGKGRYK